MATAKAPNYSPEQTAQIVADYQAGVSVEQIAQAMGKTVRSIVAKLSREKVYIAKEYKTKSGETPIKKDVHADFIGVALKLSENDIESLTKANKSALRAISDFIRNSANQGRGASPYINIMKNVALATDPKIIAFTRRAEVAVEEPLQFFIVPTDYKGFMWLIKNRILGRKLTGPSYNKHYNTLTGSMQE